MDHDFLKNIPLFEGFTEQELRRMLSCLQIKVREYEKNQVIFWEGEPAGQIGVVLSGSVLILKEDYRGNRSILSTVSPFHLFGDAFACAGEKALPVSMAAAESCSVMLVDHDKIHSPCAKTCPCHIRLIQNLLSVVAKNNLQLSRKIEFISKRTTKEKLMAYLLSEEQKAGTEVFTIPYDRQTLADYLCVERSAMSAELGKLRREGKLEVNGRQFRIIRRE